MDARTKHYMLAYERWEREAEDLILTVDIRHGHGCIVRRVMADIRKAHDLHKALKPSTVY